MLARLYPAAWQARYGAEYEALIEDAEPRARDGVDVLWGAMTMRVTARSFVRIVLPCALLGGWWRWGFRSRGRRCTDRGRWCWWIRTIVSRSTKKEPQKRQHTTQFDTEKLAKAATVLSD